MLFSSGERAEGVIFPDENNMDAQYAHTVNLDPRVSFGVSGKPE